MSSDDINIDTNKDKDKDNSPEAARQRALEERFAREAEEAQAKKNKEREQEKEQPEQQPSLIKPANILEESDPGKFFDKKKYPGYNNEEFNRYLSTKRGERQKYIAEVLSKKDSHVIPLYSSINNSPENDPLLDPDKPFTASDVDAVNSVSIEQKEFKFHDASVKHFYVMQDLDNKFSLAIQDVTHSIQNAPRGGIPAEEFQRLIENLKTAEDKRYRFGARLFLRMTDDEYNRAVNLQSVKDAVDAAIHRTAHTIPNYTKI